jgi:hypothetical protein
MKVSESKKEVYIKTEIGERDREREKEKREGEREGERGREKVGGRKWDGERGREKKIATFVAKLSHFTSLSFDIFFQQNPKSVVHQLI